MSLRFFNSRWLPTALIGALLALGCNPSGQSHSAFISNTAAATSAIDGQALVPSSLISNNGAGLISNNGAGLISNNGAGLISHNSAGLLANDALHYRIQDTGDVPLSNALVYLTDPNENFYKINGRMVSTTTDAKGHYFLSAGVPQNQPVIVTVILNQNRRVVGFTVPQAGLNHVNISLATTYVTEFLREHAADDSKTMAAYDLSQLPRLTQLTTQALGTGDLALPDLNIGKIQDMDMAYALVVGKNIDGLGDAWAQVLGHRIIAATAIAGTGVVDNGGDGGPALQGQFYRLKGVCMDHAGNIFMADEGNHRIQRIDAKTSLLSTYAGTGNRGFGGDGGPAAKAMLNFPRSVLMDSNDNLYIFDSQNVRIRRVDHATGTITTFAGNPDSAGNGFWTPGWGGDGGQAAKAQLFSPRGGAFDAQGNLYVTDGLKGTPYNTLRKITPQGIISTFAGVPNVPAGFAGDGGAATQAHFNYTNQLAMGLNNQLYIADSYNNCVRKIDLGTNIISTVAGVGGVRATTPCANGAVANQAQLNSPYGVTVDAKGDIFIGEYGFHRILVIKPDGKITVIAGGGQYTGDGDGPHVNIVEPHDIYLDPNGNLLVADARGVKLWRIWTQFGF
jgi:sugar lactone lactonase YvrE